MQRFASKASAKLLSISVTIGLIFSGFGHMEAARADGPLSFYVSPDGSDTNPGTMTAPFATIAKARDAVRAVNAAMTDDIVVYLRGGTYRVDEPVTFGESDSGTGGHEVVYRNYPGEQPVISGGAPVTEWEVYDGNIYKAAVGAGLSFETLYEDGTRSVQARYPNDGYLNVATQDAAAPKSKFGFAAGDLPVIANPAELQVYLWSGGNLNYDNQTVPVRSIDYAARSVSLLSSTTYNLSAGSRYYVQGALELLDAPGEYYYDRTAGELYYWPRGGSAPGNVDIPRTNRIFQFIGSSESSRVSGIRLEGLDIRETDTEETIKASTQDGAIYLENADHIAIRGSRIHDTGLNGIFLNGYAQNNVIYGNLIYDIGFTGVRFIGPKSIRYINHDNQVENNHIYSVGQLEGTGSGITLTLSGDNLISHNRIHDSPRFDISFSTGWYDSYLGTTIDGVLVTEDNLFDFLHTRNNVIEYNDVFDAMKDTADGGVIYSAGTGSGNIVRNNRVHDSAYDKFFGMGIYMDRDSDQVLVTHNLVDHLPASGGNLKSSIWQAGKNAVVTNNIVADSKVADSGGIVGTYFDNEELTVENNIFYRYTGDSGNSSVYSFNKWSDSLVQNADHNLIYDDSGSYRVKGWPLDSSFAGWQTVYDRHSTTENPQFVDAAGGDYRLRYDSPAYAQGFSDIDYASIGLLPDFPFADPNDPLAAIYVSADGSIGSSLNLEANSSPRYKNGKPKQTPNENSSIVRSADQATLAVSGQTANGYAVDLTGAALTYASNNTAVATVDASGTVRAFGSGVARVTVTATLAGVSRSSVIDVIVGDTLDSVQLSATRTALLPDESLPVQTVVRSAFGQYYDAATLGVQYASSDESVATVAADGTVTAHGLGTATITATAALDGDTRVGTLAIRVTDSVLADVSLALDGQSGTAGFLSAGQSASLQLAGTMTDGSAADLTASSVTYASGDESVATVGADGVVHGLSGGKTSVTATVELDGVTLSRVLPVAVLEADDVPAPWSVTRYGTAKGYVTEEDGTFRLLGNGLNIWGAEDDFVFVSQPVERSGPDSVVSVSASIESMENINTNAAVGVMLRDGSDANAANVMLRTTPGGGLQITYRSQTGGTTSYQAGEIVTFPAEIKLAREGDAFISYYKENGSWKKYKEIQTVAMGDDMLAGVGVYSIIDAPAAAVVSQVTVAQETLPLSRLEIAADRTSIPAGDSAHLTLTGYAGEHTTVDLSNADVAYESSDPSVVSVTADGTATGVSDGQAVVTATVTLNGATVSATLPITVATPHLARVDLSGTQTGMTIGNAAALDVRLLLDNGDEASLGSAASATYGSSNPAVATVAADGTVTPLAIGVTKLTAEATLNGVTLSGSVIAVVSSGTDFADGFENGLGEWTTVSGTPSEPVTERARSGSYSFKLDKDVETISHTMPAKITGVFEAWFYDSGEPGLSGGVSLQNDFFAGLKSDSSLTNYLERYGNFFNLAGPRQPGWHQIVYDLYTDAGKVNIYIDGTLAKQRALSGGASLLKIQDIWSGKISNLYFDDAAVYRMEP